MSEHDTYISRCIQLARLGSGYVLPNPMVGAVLVHDGVIIGEGYHRKYGEAHAEVNCIGSVSVSQQSLIHDSTLYVSLEPCAHTGKTPPCTHLILKHGIRKVVVGCSDPFKQVNGKGIQMLRSAGVEVETGILEKECIQLNKRFFTFHKKHRPYIVLKWAETADGTIGMEDYSRVFITNDILNRLVHKWRSEEASILVGTNTALHDDPELTNRLWSGGSPTKLVVDMDLRLPSSLKMFSGQMRTIIFNSRFHEDRGNLFYYQVTEDVNLVHQIVNGLYHHNIQSVLVEGGTKLLQSFIDDGLWDEARIIINRNMYLTNGIPAPLLRHARLVDSVSYGSNQLNCFQHVSQI